MRQLPGERTVGTTVWVRTGVRVAAQIKGGVKTDVVTGGVQTDVLVITHISVNVLNVHEDLKVGTQVKSGSSFAVHLMGRGLFAGGLIGCPLPMVSVGWLGRDTRLDVLWRG